MELGSTRRHWLDMAMAGGITASAGLARTSISQFETFDPDMSPRQAIDALYAGNRLFAAGKSTGPGAKAIYILGHTSCGAVAAATKAEPVLGRIAVFFQLIRPAVRAAHGDPVVAIREDVRPQVPTLMEASTAIAPRGNRRDVPVAGGIFDLATGTVEPVDLG